MPRAAISVIIAASGSGQRLGGGVPKQFRLIGAKPVLAYTLDVFAGMDVVCEIVVAVPAAYVAHTHEMVVRHGCAKRVIVVPGGANRAESVYVALKQLSKDTETVLIHDGVRPFVTEDLVHAVADAARRYGAAVAGNLLTDTLKQVDENGMVQSTPDRARFWRAQTPQGFTYSLLVQAYAQGMEDGILGKSTDDSWLLERLGVPVQMVEGPTGNIKITTQEDLVLAEMLLGQREAK